MNPLLLGMATAFTFLVVLLVVMVFIYMKHHKDSGNNGEGSETTQGHISNNDIFISEDEKHDEFIKSIHVVNDERTVIGTVIINGIQQEVSMEKEGDGYIYYLGNEIIGGYDPDVMGDTLIVFRENTLENELSDQIKDAIEQVIEDNRKKQEKEQEQEKERSEERTRSRNVYEQQLGYQKTIGQENDKKRELQSQEMQKRKEENLKQQRQTEKQLKTKQEKVENKVNDINIKQEVDMDTMATDMDTIGKRLEEAGKIKGDEKEGKLAFVESDDLKNLKNEKGENLQGHESRYEAVLIDKKGRVKDLNLENDTQEGNNPMERNYQVKQNKNENVEKGDVLTRLKIQGEETIGIENGQYGEVEVYHSHDKTIGGEGVEGNKSLDRQLETKNSKNAVEGPDQSTQKLAQKYQDGYRSVEQTYQEAEQHEDLSGEPCEELEVEDIDGDSNTVSHSHTDEIIAKLMQNGEISDKFTEREIRQRVEKAWNNKEEDMSKEEFQKNMEQDIEQDAANMRGERGR